MSWHHCVADLRCCLPTTSVTGVQQSTVYYGALPCRHLCMMTPCWAWLVLGWVTVSGFSPRCGTFNTVCNQIPKSTQPGHHSWVGAMRTSLRVVALQLWCTDCVGWQLKLCDLFVSQGQGLTSIIAVLHDSLLCGWAVCLNWNKGRYYYCDLLTYLQQSRNEISLLCDVDIANDIGQSWTATCQDHSRRSIAKWCMDHCRRYITRSRALSCCWHSWVSYNAAFTNFH